MFKFKDRFIGKGCKRYFIVFIAKDGQEITLHASGDNAITRSMSDNAAMLDVLAEVRPDCVIETLRKMGYEKHRIDEIEKVFSK